MYLLQNLPFKSTLIEESKKPDLYPYPERLLKKAGLINFLCAIIIIVLSVLDIIQQIVLSIKVGIRRHTWDDILELSKDGVSRTIGLFKEVLLIINAIYIFSIVLEDLKEYAARKMKEQNPKLDL